MYKKSDDLFFLHSRSGLLKDGCLDNIGDWARFQIKFRN